MKWMTLAAALFCTSGCTCGASHIADAGRDGAAVVDAGLPDASRPDASRPDAAMPVLPPGACEDVFEGTGSFACAPDTIAYCGEERCCYLHATCVDGVLAPAEVTCMSDPVEPTCALTASNAEVTVTVDGTVFSLPFAHADHGVGFATYVDLTFLPDGGANVCAAQRLSISAVGPASFPDVPEAPAYDGTHDVAFEWTDETATPRFRFFRGQVTITSSLPFRRGGPVTGSLFADDGELQVRGTFDAPECERWRTSGS